MRTLTSGPWQIQAVLPQNCQIMSFSVLSIMFIKPANSLTKCPFSAILMKTSLKQTTQSIRRSFRGVNLQIWVNFRFKIRINQQESTKDQKLMFATIPEKLPGHLVIPIYHINHIWSHLPSLERCIRGCSEIQD